MKKVEVHYAGEPALSKPGPKGKMITTNRVITVGGKPYRMEAGVHVMPESDYNAFAGTPVGQELVKRGVMKVREVKAEASAPVEAPAEEKPKGKSKAEAKKES